MVWPGSLHNTDVITRFVAREGRAYTVSVSGVLQPGDLFLGADDGSDGGQTGEAGGQSGPLRSTPLLQELADSVGCLPTDSSAADREFSAIGIEAAVEAIARNSGGSLDTAGAESSLERTRMRFQQLASRQF